MAEFKGQTSVIIQAPVEQVYNYLADFPRHPEWVQNLSKVTQISAGSVGVGTTFKTEEGPPPVTFGQKLWIMVYFLAGVFGGAKPYSEAKITALETNHRIAWQAGIRKGTGFFNFAEWEFELKPQGAATHLTQRFNWKPQNRTAERMVRVAGTAGLERSCAVSLAQLKHRLEQPTNSKN